MSGDEGAADDGLARAGGSDDHPVLAGGDGFDRLVLLGSEIAVESEGDRLRGGAPVDERHVAAGLVEQRLCLVEQTPW
jgi:hypothetical protein